MKIKPNKTPESAFPLSRTCVRKESAGLRKAAAQGPWGPPAAVRSAGTARAALPARGSPRARLSLGAASERGGAGRAAPGGGGAARRRRGRPRLPGMLRAAGWLRSPGRRRRRRRPRAGGAGGAAGAAAGPSFGRRAAGSGGVAAPRSRVPPCRSSPPTPSIRMWVSGSAAPRPSRGNPVLGPRRPLRPALPPPHGLASGGDGWRRAAARRAAPGGGAPAWQPCCGPGLAAGMLRSGPARWAGAAFGPESWRRDEE